MSERVRDGVEQLMATSPNDIIELVNICVVAESSPANTLGAYVTELDNKVASPSTEVAGHATERMLGLVPLMRELDEEVVAEFPETYASRFPVSPFQMRYEQARYDQNDRIMIPLADAGMWVRYMNSGKVREVLDQQLFVEHGGEPAFIEHSNVPPVRSRIMSLDVVPGDASLGHFTRLARERFFADTRYVTPAETVSDIAQEFDPGLLAPLISVLESECPKLQPEEHRYGILIPDNADEQDFVNGVLWGAFWVPKVREITADLCRTDETFFAEGFDEARFDEIVTHWDSSAGELCDEIQKRKQDYYVALTRKVDV